MSPGLYTELFFLDEATAFAAGHRPCAECRRERFNAFCEAWKRRNGTDEPISLAHEIDAVLHPARMDSRGAKVTWQAGIDSLPNGSFIDLHGCAYLVWDATLLLWTPEGYSRREPPPANAIVPVLTPRPIVDCFRAGYRPEVHGSRLSL